MGDESGDDVVTEGIESSKAKGSHAITITLDLLIYCQIN